MVDEKYMLNCPRCGRVEGFVPADFDDDQPASDTETEIDRDVVQTREGKPAMRVRCPRCGQWVASDRVGPA